VVAVPKDASINGKQGIPATLTITNPTNEVVMFKVKTTAPKKYCVKPNSGELEPNGTVDVQVMLQPLLTPKDSTPAPGSLYPKKNDAPSKDKFLVQSILRSFVGSADLWETRNGKDTTLWKAVPTIMEDKLKCAFSFDEGARPAPPEPALEPGLVKPTPEAAKAAVPAAPIQVQKAQPLKSKPAPAPVVPTPRRTIPTTSNNTTSKPAPAQVATATADSPQEGQARMVLLFAAFLIGILFGKYVL
jgi:hypothetical protein